MTNNDLLNITQNTEDLVIQTPLKTRGEQFLYLHPRYTLIYIFDWSIYKLKHPIRSNMLFTIPYKYKFIKGSLSQVAIETQKSEDISY